jgi:hypothetical protein
MDEHTSHELAYKKGYEKGYADGCRLVEKIKTHFAKIIVGGTVDKPYYSILYFDPKDREFHIGYSSYILAYVFLWLHEYFEVEEIEYMGICPICGSDMPEPPKGE